MMVPLSKIEFLPAFTHAFVVHSCLPADLLASMIDNRMMTDKSSSIEPYATFNSF